MAGLFYKLEDSLLSCKRSYAQQVLTELAHGD